MKFALLLVYEFEESQFCKSQMKTPIQQNKLNNSVDTE